MGLLSNIFSLLTTVPGNLIYILPLASILLGSLPSAVIQWRATGYPQARRMVIGLALLLVGQLVLFAASGLAGANFLPASLLPPIDRAILVFSMIWIVWLWAFPDPTRLGDAASALLSVVTLIACFLGILVNLTGPADGFNKSAQGILWSLLAISVLFLGTLLMFVRRPKNWETGLTVILMLLFGFLADVFLPGNINQGNYSGVIRLMSLAAYPLLLTLLIRFPIPAEGPQTNTVAVFQKKVVEAQEEAAKTDRPSQPVRERRRYSTDPKTLQTMLNLAAEVDSEKINQQIARSVAQAMLADLCFLMYIGEDKNTLHIASGYDLIREESLEGGLMSKDAVPTLANAILRGRSLRLPASSTSTDLKGLGEMLGLTNPGNLLVVPINTDKGAIGSLMLLSPYSNRLWNADDQTFVTNIAASFVPIIERGGRVGLLSQDRERARLTAEEAVAQATRLQASNADLNNQLNELKSRMEEVAGASKRQDELVAKIEQLSKENEKLRSRKEPAKQQAPAAEPTSEYQIEGELRLTLQEMAHLQNQLADANIKILELEKKQTGALTNDQAEVIASISQELRQPMSSIIGYADLLLGESVGILGALQRKFIERIRASTERIGSLIDDLIQLTTLEAGLNALKPETVDLNLIIDNAMAYTSSQLREKNTTLRIDIPENMQQIQSDREALQQILIHLLQNAGAASPVEGTVTLRVRMVQEDNLDFVKIQVTDTGGGIPKEDLPRVFSRLYRADNVLIQGVGDTGVGLSIAKTLTEAQGGRIWVDTEPNSGSTFNVQLPLKNQPVPETPKEA